MMEYVGCMTYDTNSLAPLKPHNATDNEQNCKLQQLGDRTGMYMKEAGALASYSPISRSFHPAILPSTRAASSAPVECRQGHQRRAVLV